MELSSFAELGSAIPLSGGAQAYLAYAYNPLVSFLFTWTAITTLKTGSNAIIASIFACVTLSSFKKKSSRRSHECSEYMNRIFYHVTQKNTAPDAIPIWAIKVTACTAVVFVTLLCSSTPKAATHTAVIFTTIKVCNSILCGTGLYT